MNNRENWQVKKEQYLAAAIRWLRLLLSGKAQLEDVTASDVAQAEMEMVVAAGIEPPDLCAILQGKQRNYPTFALAFYVFDRPTWDIVTPATTGRGATHPH